VGSYSTPHKKNWGNNPVGFNNGNHNNNIDYREISPITGVGKGTSDSKGLASIELLSTNYAIRHTFHLLDSNFPILCVGIIGIDLMKKYNCQIGLKPESYWLKLGPDEL